MYACASKNEVLAGQLRAIMVTFFKNCMLPVILTLSEKFKNL